MSTTLPRVSVVFLATLLLLTFGVDARTIHVSTQGSDSGNGSIQSPYRTIHRAASLARPGDIVTVHGGVYSEPVMIHTSGTANRPIHVRPHAGQDVVLRFPRSNNVKNRVKIFGDHVVFEGFRVENSGITLWGTKHVTVRQNTFSGTHGPGIWVGHSRPGVSRYNVIEYNSVFGNALMNQARNRNGGWPVALAIAVSDNAIVRGNHVYANYGEGIGVLSAHHARIENNLVHDNYSVNIYLDNAPSTTVTGNTVGTTGDSRYFRFGRPADGIAIANERTAIPLPSRNIRVIGNTIVGSRDVYYSSYGLNSGLHESVIGPNNLSQNQRLNVGQFAANRR